jgi:hypothetical protein
MKQLFMAVVFAAIFALVGYAGERAHIPPFYLLPPNWVPIIFGAIGLAVGFWLATTR